MNDKTYSAKKWITLTTITTHKLSDLTLLEHSELSACWNESIFMFLHVTSELNEALVYSTEVWMTLHTYTYGLKWLIFFYIFSFPHFHWNNTKVMNESEEPEKMWEETLSSDIRC